MEPIRVRNQGPEICKSPLQCVESDKTKSTESLVRNAPTNRISGYEFQPCTVH